MRVLFTFVGGTGHYEPLVAIAQAAEARGHEVAFACRPTMTAMVEDDGFSAFATGPDVEDLSSIAPLAAPDAEREDRVLRDGFAGRTARRRAQDLVALCEDHRPDLVVSDEVDYGAFVAAERLNLVHANVLVLAAGSFARHELLAEPLNELRAEHGLPPDPSLEMLSRHLVLAPFPPSFRDPAFPLPATAHCVRPAALEGRPVGVLPPWVADLTQRPTVYVTLGTIFNVESGDLFPRLLAGLRQLPINLIATVGRQIDPAVFGAQPPHIHIERFIPQSAILPLCDLVVSHGGSGSVVGALAHGLPMVLLPMGADQPHNARRCQELGLAEVLDPVHATAADMRDAAASVLREPIYRQNAERLRAETAALPDSAAAMLLLETLSAEKPPMAQAELIGGPEQREIVIAAYRPAWPGVFDEHRRRIEQSLAGTALRIDHVGSTAVPGLPAKPIVDLQVSVPDVEDEARYVAPLKAVGYVLRVREAGHRMLRTSELDVHVHVCQGASEWERSHLLFRDWLRESLADRDLYAAVKRSLASKRWPTMNHYAEAKSEVIAAITARAEEWAARTGWVVDQ